MTHIHITPNDYFLCCDEKGEVIIDEDGQVLQKGQPNMNIAKKSVIPELARCICCNQFFTGVFIKQHFNCNHCRITLLTKKDIANHIKDCHSKLTCYFCMKVYKTTKILSEHKLTHGKNHFECPICLKCFKCKPYVKKHMKRQHQNVFIQIPSIKHEENLTEQCALCKELFLTKIELREHINLNHSYEVVCIECKRVFKNEQCLSRHMEKKHRQIIHKCKICKYAFKDERKLIDHIEDKHTTNRETCFVCSKTFSDLPTLYKHIKDTHGSIENDYQCTLCKKIFTTKDHLKYHVYQSHKSNDANDITFNTIQNMCEYNNVMQTGKSSAVPEYKKASPPRIFCDICHKEFNKEAYLKKHQNKMHANHNQGIEIVHVKTDESPTNTLTYDFDEKNDCNVIKKTIEKCRKKKNLVGITKTKKTLWKAVDTSQVNTSKNIKEIKTSPSSLLDFDISVSPVKEAAIQVVKKRTSPGSSLIDFDISIPPEKKTKTISKVNYSKKHNLLKTCRKSQASSQKTKNGNDSPGKAVKQNVIDFEYSVINPCAVKLVKDIKNENYDIKTPVQSIQYQIDITKYPDITFSRKKLAENGNAEKVSDKNTNLSKAFVVSTRNDSVVSVSSAPKDTEFLNKNNSNLEVENFAIVKGAEFLGKNDNLIITNRVKSFKDSVINDAEFLNESNNDLVKQDDVNSVEKPSGTDAPFFSQNYSDLAIENGVNSFKDSVLNDADFFNKRNNDLVEQDDVNSIEKPSGTDVQFFNQNYYDLAIEYGVNSFKDLVLNDAEFFSKNTNDLVKQDDVNSVEKPSGTDGQFFNQNVSDLAFEYGVNSFKDSVLTEAELLNKSNNDLVKQDEVNYSVEKPSGTDAPFFNQNDSYLAIENGVNSFKDSVINDAEFLNKSNNDLVKQDDANSVEPINADLLNKTENYLEIRSDNSIKNAQTLERIDIDLDSPSDNLVVFDRKDHTVENENDESQDIESQI